MGKLQGDALAQTADTHHHLRLILDAPHVVGNEEGFAILQHSRVGLHKQYWALGLHGRAMERQVVLQIIHAYCKYLHLFSLLLMSSPANLRHFPHKTKEYEEIFLAS